MAQPAAGARPAAAAGAAAAPLPRPVVLPDEFAGTSGEDWVTYLARFNAACVVNGYTPAQRLQFLPCRLTGRLFKSTPPSWGACRTPPFRSFVRS